MTPSKLMRLPALLLGLSLGFVDPAAALNRTPPSTQIASPAHALRVHTQAGWVLGKTDAQLDQFLGIPYAAPPLGALRWRPPQAVSWAGTRTAHEYGPVCPQAKTAASAQGPQSEDCLTLNIWRPAGRIDEKLPVMLWIHGGANRIGAGSMPYYQGNALAERGVILITLNYRLGALGYFAHPELIAEAKANGENFGNYGVLDQIAALKWIRNNIASFGGNPERITLFGQSAGATNIGWLMTSPLSKGLFQAAIMMSGTHYMPLAALKKRSASDAALAQQLSPDGKLSALRALPAERWVEPLGQSFLRGFSPVIDGQVIAGDAAKLFALGRQHDVPLLIGATSYDGSVYVQLGGQASTIRKSLGKRYATAKTIYQLSGDDQKDKDQLVRAWEDAMFLSSARHLAASMGHKTSPAYLYSFNYLPAFKKGKTRGMPHGHEIPFVFDNIAASRQAKHYRAEDQQFADQIADYWVAFAKTGNPNGSGRPRWPAYQREQDNWFVLDAQSAEKPGLRKNHLDFHQQTLHWMINKLMRPAS